MNETPDHLLAPNDPAPVRVHNENGSSPFLIVADHASNSMPCGLGRLGVPESECERHIAWDIGIAGVCRFMAAALDAAVVQQNYGQTDDRTAEIVSGLHAGETIAVSNAFLLKAEMLKGSAED
jgi:hypothetical protein